MGTMRRIETIEVEDKSTQEEIEDQVRDWAAQFFSWWHEADGV
jgi:hypothetical protein